MTILRLLVATAVLVGGTVPAAAQALSLEFDDGLVRLTASNVPLSRIVSEWARLGSTTILHGERVPGTPVTLQLVGVSEPEALRVLLRGTSGFVAASRGTPRPGSSMFDRIMILPGGGPGVAPTRLSPAPATTPLFDDDFDFGDPVGGPVEAPPTPPLPRGAVPPVEPDVPPQVDPQDDPQEQEQEQEPRRTNPFQVGPGSTRPGVITPVEDDPQEP